VDGGHAGEDRQRGAGPSRTTATSATASCFHGRGFGKKLDKAYAATRANWERLYETTQTKGTSEAHPFLSPNDEFAAFEIWDKSNLDGSVPKKKEMLEFEYARSALRNGLMLEARLGANPYKFGLVGSSDAHTGLSAMEEDNFLRQDRAAGTQPGAHDKTFFHDPKTGVTVMDWEVGASGYAAVWATENTRAAIFDAMQRRETYATTGTRMLVRSLAVGSSSRRMQTIDCPRPSATPRALRWAAT